MTSAMRQQNQAFASTKTLAKRLTSKTPSSLLLLKKKMMMVTQKMTKTMRGVKSLQSPQTADRAKMLTWVPRERATGMTTAFAPTMVKASCGA